MKKLIIFIIRGYQIIPLNTHTLCRFTPTCSEYMIKSIEKYGIIKGIKLGVKRILRCHPKGGLGYDPVPEERKNL